MKFVIGIVVGVLVISYFPDAGDKVREVTNMAASEVEAATAPTPMKKLEEMVDEYRK